MPRDRANISTSLWGDPDWRKLTTAAQHVYMMILSSPSLSYCGVADWRPSRLTGFSEDLSVKSVQEAANALSDAHFIVVDEAREEVLIRSFLRHDGILKQPRLSVSMANAYASVSSPVLRKVIVHELRRLEKESPEWKAWGQPKVKEILKHDAIDPKQFAQFGVQEKQALGEGLGSALPIGLPQTSGKGLGLTTSTATATSSKEDTSSSEIANAIPRPDVNHLLDLLDERIVENGLKKPSRTKKNADAGRLLLDRDGYTVEQVEWMIRWATGDEFWRSNILSMSKLREKFPQLLVKSGASTQKGSATPVGVIDPDAILGRDYWAVPAPPEGLTIEEEMAWKAERRAEHQAERITTARRKLEASRG